MTARVGVMGLGVVLVVALASLACRPAKAPTATAPETRPPEVRIWGALHEIMHEGKVASRVALAAAVPGPHSYAVGALGDLRGEITVVDGEIWLAYPQGATDVGLVRTRTTDERAALLVAADVPAWSGLTLEDGVADEGLDAAIEGAIARAGHDLNQPLPLIIEGRARRLRWHVLSGPAAAGVPHAPGADALHAHARAARVRELDEETPVTLVGFFSRRHEGVFTHRGQHTHLHVVITRPPATGHVDRVDLQPGCTLKLPARGP